MSEFVGHLFEKAGVPPEDAGIIASHLVDSDTHGIFSHGTAMTPQYITKIIEGSVNPRPDVQFIHESGSVRVVDGDGGLGHPACDFGMRWAISEAKRSGLAAVTTRNHHHIGAAGTFARMALAHDCIGMVISSSRHARDPSKSVRYAHPGGPISVAVPAGEQPPLVMDKGGWAPWSERVFEDFPSIYLKDLALGSVLQALGGTLAGIHRPDLQAEDRPWASDQGSFLAVFDVGRFMPVEEFKLEMDRVIGEAREMRPYPGFPAADLAGGPEWRSRSESLALGIPVGTEHERGLTEIADKLGVETPFPLFENKRFKSDQANAAALTGFGKRLIKAARRRLFR
ncbi:MAG TPA: Ldh family oxidoreductase [Rhodothermales bacterium]|nr:Ldh family oxidoreductase [Rhodothermales bacterium]